MHIYLIARSETKIIHSLIQTPEGENERTLKMCDLFTMANEVIIITEN